MNTSTTRIMLANDIDTPRPHDPPIPNLYMNGRIMADKGLSMPLVAINLVPSTFQFRFGHVPNLRRNEHLLVLIFALCRLPAKITRSTQSISELWVLILIDNLLP